MDDNGGRVVSTTKTCKTAETNRFNYDSPRPNIRGGYSSGVEHSTADREVPGSIPGVPLFSTFTTKPNIANV